MARSRTGPANFGGLGPGKPQPNPKLAAAKQKPAPRKGAGLSLKNRPTIKNKI